MLNMVMEKIQVRKFHEISINPTDDGGQRKLASMVYKFFDKKTGPRTNIYEVPLMKNLNAEQCMQG